MPELKTLTYLGEAVPAKVIFTPEVLVILSRHVQDSPNKPEAGGQLFATFERQSVTIRQCSEPHPKDRRSRFMFWPWRHREREEIMSLYREGLHFVGDWHTHPEPIPSPSRIDLDSIQRIFRESKHQLSHFILLIVGTTAPPGGLWVGAHDGTSIHRLHWVEDDDPLRLRSSHPCLR